MTPAEVEGSVSKKTLFSSDTTETVYLEQADGGPYSPSYDSRSVNPLSVMLLLLFLLLLLLLFHSACFVEFCAISCMNSTHIKMKAFIHYIKTTDRGFMFHDTL